MSGLDPATRAGLEEALNALVPEASNHFEIVARSATRSKCSSNPLEVRIPDSTKKRGLKTERLNETISSGPPCKLSSKFQSFNPHRQAVDLIGFFSISS